MTVSISKCSIRRSISATSHPTVNPTAMPPTATSTNLPATAGENEPVATAASANL